MNDIHQLNNPLLAAYQQSRFGSTAQTTSESNQTGETITNSNNANKSEPAPRFAVGEVYVSPRSKLLQQINGQFFDKGKIRFEDLPNYIQSLQDNGLISASPLDEQVDSNPDELGEIENYVTKLSQWLEQQDPESGLLAPLGHTKQLLSNMDSLNNAEFQQHIVEAKRGFASFFESDESDELTEQQRGALG